MSQLHGPTSLKSDVSPPRIASDGHLQPSEESKPPLLEDVMQLSRLGEIEPLRRLFEEGKIGADFKDHEGITPLHVGPLRGYPELCS